ncbi:MAG TPA: zf-TFIIB domain-containing protein [Pirellulaceae bacterium]|nr:zf-TFIIB domain-containing protein [Pirellulaceae bacterium]
MSERGAGIVCPRCREETRFAELFGIKVVACPFCLGFMTQGCEFRHLVETLRKQYRGPNQLNGPLDALQLHHVCQCTVCGSQMDTHPFAGPGAVVIDSCPHCKLVWLDCGELLRIKRAPGRR